MRLLFFQMQVSVAVVIVLLLRQGMKKLPKVYSYILWLLVFARLLCPVSFESDIAVMPSMELDMEAAQTLENISGVTEPSDATDMMRETDIIDKGGAVGTVPVSSNESGEVMENVEPDVSMVGNMPQPEERTNMEETTAKIETTATKGNIFRYMAVAVRGAGAIIIVFYNFAALKRIKKSLKNAEYSGENVYVSREITTPFTLGLMHPRIYIPAGLGENEREYILCHERIHIRRKDYMIKNIAFLLTALYWFNPMVWVAFFMMERDMEMSCDEAVVKKMGEGIKKQYSQSLLDFAAGKKNPAVAGITFAENSVKQRVKNILTYRNAKKWAWAAGVIIILAAGFVIFSVRGGGKQQLEVFPEDQDNPLQNMEEYDVTQFQDYPQKLLERWAVAFKDKNAAVMYALSMDKENFVSWDMVHISEDGVYTLEYTNPWVSVGGYEVSYKAGKDTATIRYNMSTPQGEIYLAEEVVNIIEENDLYYANHMNFTIYSQIDTIELFETLYGSREGYTMSDYGYLDFSAYGYSIYDTREIFRHLLTNPKEERYADYCDVVKSAEMLLHIEGEAVEILPYSADRAVIRYRLSDGEIVDIPMIRIEDTVGIWFIDMGEAAPVKKVYSEEVLQDGAMYQITNYGIYRKDKNASGYTCIFPYYVPSYTKIVLEDERILFEYSSIYRDGDLDWMSDCIYYVDTQTGEYGIWKMLDEEEIRRYYEVVMEKLYMQFVTMWEDTESILYKEYTQSVANIISWDETYTWNGGDQLVLLAQSGDKTYTIYGCLLAGRGAEGIIVDYYDGIEHHVEYVWDIWHTGYDLPSIAVNDYDGDGREEAAFTYVSGGGTYYRGGELMIIDVLDSGELKLYRMTRKEADEQIRELIDVIVDSEVKTVDIINKNTGEVLISDISYDVEKNGTASYENIVVNDILTYYSEEKMYLISMLGVCHSQGVTPVYDNGMYDNRIRYEVTFSPSENDSDSSFILSEPVYLNAKDEN